MEKGNLFIATIIIIAYLPSGTAVSFIIHMKIEEEFTLEYPSCCYGN